MKIISSSKMLEHHLLGFVWHRFNKNMSEWTGSPSRIPIKIKVKNGVLLMDYFDGMLVECSDKTDEVNIEVDQQKIYNFIHVLSFLPDQPITWGIDEAHGSIVLLYASL